MLMSLELMLLAVNVNFILCSVYLDDFMGQIFALLVLTVAAAESAIGLAILVVGALGHCLLSRDLVMWCCVRWR